MKKFPVADLHCDLLLYLAGGNNRTVFDSCVCCSLPQLRQGGIIFQALPLFSETHPNSARQGEKQAQLFNTLPALFGSDIEIRLAIENASVLLADHEPLDKGLERLAAFNSPILYASLTWNTENRFGGGAHTSIGLKEDGKILLDHMSHHRIAVDLSHTSDALAYDILDYIDRRSLPIRVIASHSNVRAITDVPRNLPDELIKEIIRRKGIIGLNFIRFFVGSDTSHKFIKHLEHLLSLDAQKHVCFGADFFYYEDVSPKYRKPPKELFFEGYEDATTYGKLLSLWQEHLNLSDDVLEDIAFRNLQRFLKS